MKLSPRIGVVVGWGPHVVRSKGGFAARLARGKPGVLVDQDKDGW